MALWLLAAGAWLFLTVLLIWPVISSLTHPRATAQRSNGNSLNYLVVAPQALGQTATAWADYRMSTGYRTAVVLVGPGQETGDAVRDTIWKMYPEQALAEPFYVLLIGHAHPASSHPDTFLPAPHFALATAQFSGWGKDPIASDDAIGPVSPGGIPRIPSGILIGRIPARTEAEGLRLLERIRRYEQNPPTGAGRARIELIASNAGFGPQYDTIFEWAIRTLVRTTLPDEYQWHMLYGNPQSPYSYPIETFPNEVARRLDAGALAAVYTGHGQPEMVAWALSPGGQRAPVFRREDSGLITDAGASLAIITACSAGTYDLAGDDLSVVESIFLTTGGPVATYSPSAWINPTLDARLLTDIFEALMQDSPPTLGQWVAEVESSWDPLQSRTPLIGWAKDALPRLSSNYEGKALLSASEARQALDIQNATYNLFGDPALRLVYPQPTIDISPAWPWQPTTRSVAFSGKSGLPAGNQIQVSLEALPGEQWSGEQAPVGSVSRYNQANNVLIAAGTVTTGPGGQFAGRLSYPSPLPSGRYVLRALAVRGADTFVGAHPIYLGWTPIIEWLSAPQLWWLAVGTLLLGRAIEGERRKRAHIASRLQGEVG